MASLAYSGCFDFDLDDTFRFINLYMFDNYEQVIRMVLFFLLTLAENLVIFLDYRFYRERFRLKIAEDYAF